MHSNTVLECRVSVNCFRVGGCSIKANDFSIRMNYPSIKVGDCFIRVSDCQSK